MSKKRVKCRDGHESVVMGYKTMCPQCGAPFVEEEVVPTCEVHGIPMEKGLEFNASVLPQSKSMNLVVMSVLTIEEFECPTCLSFVKKWLDKHGLKAMEVEKNANVSNEV